MYVFETAATNAFSASPQPRVTRSQTTRLPTAEFHMTTRRSKSTSKDVSVHASTQTSVEASNNVSAESSASSTRRPSLQEDHVVESPRPAKRTRLAKKEAQVVTQPESQMVVNEHSFPTVPSIEDFATPPIGRSRKRKAQQESEEVEQELVNGEQSQEVDQPLKRTRAQKRAVESEVDGVDSEQPQESGPPVKKRRAPPIRTGPRKGKGRGRGRKKMPGSELPNFDDEPFMIALKERQAALKVAFAQIAIPHVVALEELARRDLEKLRKNKDAHKEVPEYEMVLEELQEILAQRQEVIRKEYENKKAYAIAMLEKEKEVINNRHRVSPLT